MSFLTFERTLQSILAKSNLTCIHPSAARVLHIGNCGRHHKFDDCDATRDLEALESQILMLSKNFFPTDMLFDKELILNHIYDTNNGGWGDLRDKLLCKSFVDKKFLIELNKLGTNLVNSF